MKPSLFILAATAFIAACDAGAPVSDAPASAAPASAEASPTLAAAMGNLSPDELSPQLLQDLARARAATARFQRFAAADDAEYDLLFLDMCMENQPTGGMGYHYVNVGLLDGVVEVERPEAVMYEPGPNGQLRLVGLEYVIPAAAWTSEDPPVLFGQELELNQFDLWALHVWLWKRNPSGIFEPWNPNVSCANAEGATVAGRSHH
ncbi:MAG: hypothetical protein ACM357_09060 [Gemmatimonadota bacterium]